MAGSATRRQRRLTIEVERYKHMRPEERRHYEPLPVPLSARAIGGRDPDRASAEESKESRTPSPSSGLRPSLPINGRCPSPSTAAASGPSRRSGCSGVPASDRRPGRRGSSRARACECRPLADPAEGQGAAARPRSARRRRAAARPRRRLGPRPPLVARPDGPHRTQPLVERMTLELARLVRDRRRRRSRSSTSSRTSCSASARSARSTDLLLEVTRDPAMLVWLSGNENTKRAPERELRARADGAVHARRERAATARTTSASRRGR